MSTRARSIEPITFGKADRGLFGIVHAPDVAACSRAGVVLCNAFGQEAIRAQRTMWVLAERLARAGHAVLRFDYYGTGDSPGDDLDADLDGWAEDVRQADRELRARFGGGNTVWIGMRLGAAVAVRAAQRPPETLVRAILWDPVVDGVRYLDYLRARHVASLESAFGIPPEPAPTLVARDPATYRDEALGFALPPLLRQQVSSIQPTPDRAPGRPASIVVVADPELAEGNDLHALGAAVAAGAQVVAVRHGIDWTGDSGALVPGPAIAQLVQHAAA